VKCRVKLEILTIRTVVLRIPNASVVAPLQGLEERLIFRLRNPSSFKHVAPVGMFEWSDSRNLSWHFTFRRRSHRLDGESLSARRRFRANSRQRERAIFCR